MESYLLWEMALSYKEVIGKWKDTWHYWNYLYQTKNTGLEKQQKTLLKAQR